MNEDKLRQIFDKAAREGWDRLDLCEQGLTELPREIGQLKNLTTLYLHCNQLTHLPPEIAELKSLTDLFLTQNQLTHLPREIGQLKNLDALYLSENQLGELPPEIGLLTNLTGLYANQNRLAKLPPAVGQLTNLTHLYLRGNQLTNLPPGIGLLNNLARLFLRENQLRELPPEIGHLAELTELRLEQNQLKTLPPEIGQLANLRTLDLDGNELRKVPPEIGQLANLRTLDLDGNELRKVPPEIGQLTNLTHLYLTGNQLTDLPPEIGQLASLTGLYLYDNQLAELPPEIGRLRKLSTLSLDGNPLTSLPPPVVAQGTQAVLAYLRGQLKARQRQWVSKLLLVGEGGVGKTSLLKVLRGEAMDSEEPTTHGIDVGTFDLQHPELDDVTMQLNSWDFGGQEIYHATHQFFLTSRSLFLLLWHARLGWEAGKLRYWLDTVQAKAPESPVIIVATHIDERDTDLPYDELCERYPQIAGHFDVSNKEATGIEKLRDAMAKAAADLPLMGLPWPARWLEAANALRESTENHITPKEMHSVISGHDVEDNDAPILAQWLHDLGDLLYFRDDPELNDIVILKPQWVSKYVSEVLESKGVVAGELHKSHMRELWSDLDTPMQDHFIRLMERFDLSYRTLQDETISIVVERLSQNAPDYASRWEVHQDASEIAMRFYLSTVPAGIPSYFIARSHRFTTHTHWLYGALFTDRDTPEHLALVRAFPNARPPHDCSLELKVRGPYPHSFFALLKDGLELTLARFPGLQIKRTIPCPGHDGDTCTHEFDYAQLLKRLERIPPKFTIECSESGEDVDVRQLLFGLAPSTQDDVLARIEERFKEAEAASAARHAELMAGLKELTELAQREFTNAFRREQSKIELHCPNVFVLRPAKSQGWLQFFGQEAVGRKMELELYCQAPGQWHPALDGGRYEFAEPPGWLETLAPYVAKLVGVLKYAAPLAGPALAALAPGIEKVIGNDVKLMTELVKKLPEIEKSRERELEAAIGERMRAKRITGAPLRALRRLLDELDPDHRYGGLRKVLTPEGHYLWLCDHHAQEYLR